MTDKKSNSILHMVGKKEEKIELAGKTRRLALKLQDNLLLFEEHANLTNLSKSHNITSISKTFYQKHSDKLPKTK